jgi:hypothetical protein
MMLAADMAPPVAITICQPRKPAHAREYWSWREIDGRPCWYAGRPGKPKSELRWRVESVPPEGRGVEPVARPPQRHDDGLPPNSPPPPPTITPEPTMIPGGFDDRWGGLNECRAPARTTGIAVSDCRFIGRER